MIDVKFVGISIIICYLAFIVKSNLLIKKQLKKQGLLSFHILSKLLYKYVEIFHH